MEGKSYEYYVNLINSGKKLEAVKSYLEEQNCSLKEASEYIDSLEKRCSVYSNDRTSDDELIKLIRAGKKIEAIKVYRESTRCTLKEAKEYVEKTEYSSGISTSSSGIMKSPQSGKTKFEGCFIATVCYDGYDTSEVMKFREFRDDVLLKSFPGKAFVKSYYFFSPMISVLISKSYRLKIFIRKYILDSILKNI